MHLLILHSCYLSACGSGNHPVLWNFSPGIRVAGGLLIASLGFRMVFGSSDVRVEGAGPQPAGDIAFTPLAMPSLSGPGSISVVLTMSSEVPTNMLVNGHVVVIIGIAITCAIAGSSFVCQRL